VRRGRVHWSAEIRCVATWSGESPSDEMQHHVRLASRFDGPAGTGQPMTQKKDAADHQVCKTTKISIRSGQMHSDKEMDMCYASN